MKNTSPYLTVCCWLIWIFIVPISKMRAENDERLEKKIYLPETTTSIYELFETISGKTGYLFLYDSDLIDNEKIVTVHSGENTIRETIKNITGIADIDIRIMGNHILLKKPDIITITNLPNIVFLNHEPEISWFTVEGILQDKYSLDPIPFASLRVSETSIGTITNQNGEFRIRIPDSLQHHALEFSHVGFLPLEIPIGNRPDHYNTLQLVPKVISLQEVVVRLVKPTRLIHEMLEKREENYALTPVYLTTFYRESIEKRKRITSITEAVFKVYKPPYNSPNIDQVKLLKMRKIVNKEEKDTVVLKMKSGIRGSLMLDVMKNLPDFLTFKGSDEINDYNYYHHDLTVIDGRVANVINFEKKYDQPYPLYKGELYIDSDNDALLMARFEIDPKDIERATPMFVERKARGLNIKAHKVTYTVTYKEWNGRYYINHIRGDLWFHIRKKRHLFNSQLHMWFEMVTSAIDTDHVRRFPRSEVLPNTSIFAETKFDYDHDFWGSFNTIQPEEKISETLSRMIVEIEETLTK